FSSRDEYFFNLNADPSNLKKMDDQISDAYSALRYWQDSPLPPEVIPDKLPVIFPDPPEGGDLWNIESYSPDAFRKNAGLDILIIGSVVRVGDYFGLRISALGSSGEEVLWEGAGGEDELEDISLEAGASARNLVLGRSWSSITVQTEPPSAVITSSGKNVGVGLWADSTLKPGTYIIVITASGYKPKIENITLTPNELRFINVSLEKVDQPQILIRSEPAGASVRLGSIWLGRAPLSVDQPDRVMSVTLEKEGFRTRTVPLYPDVERLTIPLDYVLVDPVDELAAGRKKLYSSIAWFSFSLAPTVILLGVSQNYANMNFASSSPEDYNSSYKAYQISYGLMWGSIAVNIGLLTNVLFKLSRYLKAAEGLSD
ncbi:MAG: PEGA domain-containing protein, partial [Spirochaetaceae bacterium]|nr:PEGA domain-containing protein [Spirochaetaceae bacterium]